MNEQKIRIEMTGPGQGKIFIDGVEIHRVAAIELDLRPQTANLVKVTVFADVLVVTGDAIVETTEIRNISKGDDSATTSEDSLPGL